ncbi:MULTISPECIES: hypothetical protein [Citrobacter]|uniref:hypothetical protein n=1 Tax=Citrobacter sp. RHBSTW-00229 TaxID=2742641 RepID=UPI0020181E42|nr:MULTISPECIES: hypothetical protein [Citrobacter]
MTSRPPQPRIKLAHSIQGSSTVIRPWMYSPVRGATNGMQVMSAYVETVFGVYGRVLLAGIYSA